MSGTAQNGEVWVGLAEVIQRPGAGVLMDRSEAFVNVLILADSHEDYLTKTRAHLNELGFDLVEIEDVEPFSHRARFGELEHAFLSLANDAARTKLPQLGPFHTWTSEA